MNSSNVPVSMAMSLLLMALCACQPSDTDATPAANDISPLQQTPNSSSNRDMQGIKDMPALERLLSTYASATPASWDAFISVAGVEWTETEKTENPDAKPENAYNRSGKITLSGFAETDLPNGKTGPEADYVRGNEGESGVTLNGTAKRVTSIAVNKFYPDQDYRKVLENQIGTDGSVRAVATDCRLAEGTTSGEANASRNEFFELTLPNGSRLFAEGSVDANGGKYSPGSTTYFFYKEEPAERIEAMQCKRS